MKLTCSSTTLLLAFIPLFMHGQTESQLRDPEYLVAQYNQLVAKHNALIEKTRGLITKASGAQIPDPGAEQELRQAVNEAMAKAATLENQLTKMKQEGLRTDTSNQYLDDTNARLRRQLQELKADEQDLAQRNKELTAKNRRLSNTQKSFDAQEKARTQSSM